MPSIRRREQSGYVERKETTQGTLMQKVESWSVLASSKFSVYTLSGNRVAQMSMVYGETTHLLLTRLRGVTVGTDRVIVDGDVYEPTYVNEDGRRSQVFCRKVESVG